MSDEKIISLKINGWNLNITQLKRVQSSSKPPFMGSKCSQHVNFPGCSFFPEAWKENTWVSERLVLFQDFPGVSRCPRQNYCQVEGFSNCPTNLKQSIPCNRMSALEEFNFGNISMYLMNDGILSEYDEGFCPIQLYIHSILSEYDVFLLHVFFLFFGGVLIPVGSFFREC